MTDQIKQEFTLKISQANKTQMIVVIYDMFLVYLREAEDAYAIEDNEEFRRSIRRAKECNKELMNSLDVEYHIALMLLQLYIYVNKELTSAEIYKNNSHLEIVATVITGLQEAYLKVANEDTSKPVMENIQTVYAGLTYGKNDLVENISQSGTNRGFLA